VALVMNIPRDKAEKLFPQRPKPQLEEDSITFTGFWKRWTGKGPQKGRLFYSRSEGDRAEWSFTGKAVALIHKAGPDCGIAHILIDGRPVRELDTWSPKVEWNRRTLLRAAMPEGRHTVAVEVSGRQNVKSKNAYIQIVGLDAGAQEPAMLWGDEERLGRPFAKDPSVIRFGSRHLMYYSMAAWSPDLAPPGAHKGCWIGIAESRDLVTWKKVGQILPEQECEQYGLVNGRIILLGGKLHLFYNTYGNGAKDALCHATSADGIHFTRNSTNPVVRQFIEGRTTGPLQAEHPV
jgi:hypothetical protein